MVGGWYAALCTFQWTLIYVGFHLVTECWIFNSDVLFSLCETVRLEEEVDNYVEKTVKFVYVHWVGERVPFTKKGKFGVVHGSVQEHFQVWDKILKFIKCWMNCGHCDWSVQVYQGSQKHVLMSCAMRAVIKL